ncbi:MAG: hypothetical protein PW792_16195 [Acidobacteriaceae bacterium]|nr:hypothetical protein [Acidobacteriaceae bacterium]
MLRTSTVLRGLLAAPFLIASLVGCGGSSSSVATPNPIPVPTPTGVSTLYAIVRPTTQTPFQVQTFPATSSGAVTASSTLTLPTGLQPEVLALDSNGALYVAGMTGAANGLQVMVYAAGATGTATPTRTITMTSATYDGIQSMAFDSSNNLWLVRGLNNLYVIQEFSPTADGAATPMKSISGANTLLNSSLYTSVNGITFDSDNNLYVLTNDGVVGYAISSNMVGRLLVFPANSDGNVTPTRSFTTRGVALSSLVLDSSRDVYIAENPGALSTTPTFISEYGPTTSGVATALKTITFPTLRPGAMNTMHIDNATNRLFAAMQTQNTGGTNYLIDFPTSATGDTTPASVTVTSGFYLGGYGFDIR